MILLFEDTIDTPKIQRRPEADASAPTPRPRRSLHFFSTCGMKCSYLTTICSSEMFRREIMSSVRAIAHGRDDVRACCESGWWPSNAARVLAFSWARFPVEVTFPLPADASASHGEVEHILPALGAWSMSYRSRSSRHPSRRRTWKSIGNDCGQRYCSVTDTTEL